MKSNPLAAALKVPQGGASRKGSMEEAPPKRPSRPGKRQVPVYLPIPVHEYLRRLAFESRRSMHSILMEGLDKVLRENGTSVERLVQEGEES